MFLILSLHSFTFFISRSIGFSQNTALCALLDLVINSVCVGVADAIKTESILESVSYTHLRAHET